MCVRDFVRYLCWCGFSLSLTCVCVCMCVCVVLEKALLKSLQRLDGFLRTPLSDEIDGKSADRAAESSRSFLDGSDLTLADCNLLPKLHILKVRAHRGTAVPTWQSDLDTSVPDQRCVGEDHVRSQVSLPRHKRCQTVVRFTNDSLFIGSSDLRFLRLDCLIILI